MKKITHIVFILLAGFGMHAIGYGFENPPDQSASILKKQLEQAKQRANSLERSHKKLERLIQQGQKNLKRYSKTLKTYKYNLEEAQKVIDAAQSEIDQIRKRNDARELMIYKCIYQIDTSLPIFAENNSPKHLIQQSVIDAAIDISEDLFAEKQDEIPRLKELLGVVENRQAYQNRIINKYMPADLQKKEAVEVSLDQKESKIKETKAASDEIQKQVAKLRQQLEAAQKKIEEIRRQQRLAAARKKKREQEAKQSPQGHTPKPVVKRNGSFASLRGYLPWPAQGEILRPYGEFTHPQFKVKIKSPGIDIKVETGTKVSAVADGLVVYTGEIPGFGPTVLIDHGNDYLTVYGNIAKNVNKNQQIQSRDIIGTVISDKNSQFATFHFEIRYGEKPLNPQLWFAG